jgi:hypothetical protein
LGQITEHEYLSRFFGTNIMRATYGFEDIGKNASLIHDAEQLIQRLGVINTPGGGVPRMGYSLRGTGPDGMVVDRPG